MEFLGAKGALTMFKDLEIGMADTGAYYTEAEFLEGFRKTMKFQPRVVKQNRGSSGEGIWIDSFGRTANQLRLLRANYIQK